MIVLEIIGVIFLTVSIIIGILLAFMTAQSKMDWIMIVSMSPLVLYFLFCKVLFEFLERKVLWRL